MGQSNSSTWRHKMKYLALLVVFGAVVAMTEAYRGYGGYGYRGYGGRGYGGRYYGKRSADAEPTADATAAADADADAYYGYGGYYGRGYGYGGYGYGRGYGYGGYRYFGKRSADAEPTAVA